MKHCYPHHEAQKYSQDGKTLFVVCTECGATLREVDPRGDDGGRVKSLGTNDAENGMKP